MDVGALIERPRSRQCGFAAIPDEMVTLYRRAWCSAQRINNTMLAGGKHTTAINDRPYDITGR